jgi:hypothetical protein
MDKKAVVSVQFNWMLVLIIGGLILIFFVGIVQKQREISASSIAEAIQVDLQSILTSSHVSTETASIIEIPSTEIKFSCEGFKVGNQFPAKFLYAFSPDVLRSDRNTISVFAYDWSVPYRITNFLYVTSPDIKYVVDSNSGNDIINALGNLLPPRYITKDGKQKLFMNWDKGDTANIANTNNYKVRIISFVSGCSPPPSISNTKPKDVSALCVNLDCSGSFDEQFDCKGRLTFGNYNENGDWTTLTSNFAGKASLLAAIFSENKEIYECGMENAIDRMQDISSIYEKKAENLQTYYSSSPQCPGYMDALTAIGGIKSVSSISIITSLQTNIESLKTANEQLLASSCPAVY